MPNGPEGQERQEGQAARIIEAAVARERIPFYISEYIKDPDVAAEAAEPIIIHDFLWPFEYRGADIQFYEEGPILNDLLRRAGRDALAGDLTNALVKQREGADKLLLEIKRLKEEGVSDESLADEIMKHKVLDRQAGKTQEILETRVRETQGKEWFRIYKQVKAASKLERLYNQRIEAQVDIKQWAALFENPFAMVNMYTSEMAEVLDAPDYGPATETALEAILDVHLEGGFRDPDDETKFLDKVDIKADDDVTAAATELKMAAAQRKPKLERRKKNLEGEAKKRRLVEEEQNELKKIGVELEEVEALEKMKLDGGVWQGVPVDELKVLQKSDHINQRLTLLTAAIKEHTGRMHPDLKDRDFVLTRSELLVRHFASATQLTGWLAIPRENIGGKGEHERWEAAVREGELPEFGNAIFEEAEGPNDAGTKLFESRYKYWNEFSKYFPAGPRALIRAWPKDLGLPFLHDPAAASVYVDEEGEIHYKRSGKPNESIISAWYFRNKTRGKDKKVSLSQVFRNVDDGAFSFWVYHGWRRNQLLLMLRADLPVTERENVIDPLLVMENVSAMNKTFAVSFRGRRLEGELLKINLVAARIIAWTYGKVRKPKEMGRDQEVVMPKQAVGESTVDRIGGVCQDSGFLNTAGWEIVKKLVEERRLMSLDELSRKYRIATALVRRKGEKGVDKKITSPEDIRKHVAEVQRADRLVELFAEEREKLEGKEKEDPEKLDQALAQARNRL